MDDGERHFFCETRLRIDLQDVITLILIHSIEAYHNAGVDLLGPSRGINRDPAHGAEAFDDVIGDVPDAAIFQLLAGIDAGTAGIGFLDTIMEDLDQIASLETFKQLLIIGAIGHFDWRIVQQNHD